MKFKFLMNCAFEQIKNHKFIHVVLVIVIMVSSVILGWLSIVTRLAVLDTKVVSSFKNHEVYFVEAGGIRSDFKEEDYISMHNDYLKARDIENIHTGLVMKSVSYDVTSGKNIRLNMYVYQDLIKENLELNLSEGVQLYEYDGEYIPIILTDNHYLLKQYGIGDVLDITGCYQEFEDDRSTPFEKETEKYQICGIIKRPYKYFVNDISFGSSANILNDDNSETIISADWVTSDGRLASERLHYNNPMSFNFMAKITAPKGTAEYDEAYNFLISDYVVNSYSYFIELSSADYQQAFADATYILICIMGFIVVGISSINIYIGKKQTKDFAIYFLSGAKWSDCIFIDLFRNLFVIVLPTLISSLACGLYYSQFLKETYTTGGPIDVISVFFVLLFMSVVFAISSLPYIIKLKNTEPITFVRTMNRE